MARSRVTSYRRGTWRGGTNASRFSDLELGLGVPMGWVLGFLFLFERLELGSGFPPINPKTNPGTEKERVVLGVIAPSKGV